MSKCPICGSEWLRIQALFDEDGTICFYDLEAECNACGHPMTAPTPPEPTHLYLVK